MNNIKTKCENLLNFLIGFNKLKNKPQLNINSFEKVLWFYEIPKGKECYSILDSMTSNESVNFDKWIKIKKPKRKQYPSPPDKIKPWIEDGILEKYNETPQALGYIFDKENNKIFLDHSPKIQKLFENYLNKSWLPWSQEEKRLEVVKNVYNRLYDIYKKNELQSESYKIVLGLGFLSAKNRQGKDIKRHIVTTPLTITFNSVSGTITVMPGDQTAELSLEMDMFTDSEKPKNCDKINYKLSELSNDFWIKNSFYNSLKSWLNSYDSEGQFFKNFTKSFQSSKTTLTVSPAIILKKRNEKDFLKFYTSTLKVVETKKELNFPCLNDFMEEQEVSLRNDNKNHSKNGLLEGKYYFPLPANDEQRKVIKKIENNNQIVVQGPPGTGKTHSIANLICHFLAKGQKILVTSQTDRALKVLRDKLPQQIQPLCIEILGKDQKSFQELKNSFEVINSKYQNWDQDHLFRTIKKLEKKDNDLKGELASVKLQLVQMRHSETKNFEKLFGFYTGTPAIISQSVKEEEKKYKWIKEYFDLKSDTQECPVSSNEAVLLFEMSNKFKNTDESVFEESIDFLTQIFNLKNFKEKLQKEKIQIELIKKYKIYINTHTEEKYEVLKHNDLSQLQQKMNSLQPKIESLLNRNKRWITQALKDCLADKDREWKYLYEETNKNLDDNKNMLRCVPISVRDIKTDLPSGTNLTEILNIFFKTYSSNDKIKWGWLCHNTVRKLKKIKINNRPLSSYKEVKVFKNFMSLKKVFDTVNHLWSNQGIDVEETKNFNFQKNYHVFKDMCEPLCDCLSIHRLLESINKHFLKNNIPQPQWTVDSVKKEACTVNLAMAQKELKIHQNEFKNIVSVLTPYKNQKNGIAKKIINAINNKNFEEYKKALDAASHFKTQKKDFSKFCQIKEKLQNELFCKKLEADTERHIWEERLTNFEKSWSWHRADLWIKKQTSEENFEQLNQVKEDLLKKQKQNMEQLASENAWSFCLSYITDEDIRSLKGWMQSIKKIGKGTGVTAAKHRKVARKRMDECKTAIPAWIMPLYRVVENIKPDSEPFDIIIIDEASQTGPDGFLLNYLAKKIIIVGDKEQISPENPGIKDDDVEILKRKWLSDINFSEYIGREYSYYDFCETLFTKSHIQLREHFRCMPEIIQFSNIISYSGTPLIPMRQYGKSRLEPLRKVFVPDAVSKVGNSSYPQNEKEAQAIVKQIKECMSNPGYNGKTFGIISLQGKSQVKVIEKALQQIDKKDMEERAIQVGNAYDFQGDERDVMFLSMGISKDWNISALTRELYKRQYNVATSRAKDQMWLFHSVEKNDLLNQEGFRRQLLDHFDKKPEIKGVWDNKKLQELYQKIQETKIKNPDNAPDPFDSWFEARVFYKIALRGYHVIPQHEVSGYFIDMIVVGSNGKLAIECDGDYWHSEEKEKEDDLQRQWNLERCGWTFWRIRESAFNRDEDEALKSLWDLLEKNNQPPCRSE